MQSVKRDACENVEEWSVKVEPCKSGTKWKMSGTFVTLVNVGDSAALKRVKKKVEKLRKLDNCFIVQYFGLAKPNSSRYIVSEISDGSLADYVENKLINIGDIEDHVVINQVAIALSYLHAKCIVHWRLEPEDIHLIRHSSELITAKIGYFKVHSVQQDRRWMAPEANSDQFHPTKASNVWDLGMLTIFLITRGKMEAADIEEIKARDLTERLTNTNPKRRPPAHMIAYHPYFLTSTPSRSHFAGRINRLSIYPQILCVITSNTKVMAWYEKQNDKWKEDESSLTDLLKAAKMIRKCAERLFLTNVEEEEFISQDSTVNASTSDPLPILVDKLLVAAVPLFDLYFWSCLCALGLEKAKKIFLMSDVQIIVVRSSTELLHGRQPPSAEDDVVQSAIDARRPEMITFLFHDWHFKPKSGWLHDIIGREWVSSELLASVLKFGFDSNWNDSNRRTVLHLAASVNQKPTKEIVQLLLDHGADPDLTDESNRKPLHFAVSFSNPETVRLLLKATSRPLTKCKGWTLLHLAALFQADSPEIYRLLLNEGQNPNATDNMRDTPLHLAT